MNYRMLSVVLSAVVGVLGTACLIYMGHEDQAGYAVLAGFVLMVLATPNGKKVDNGATVVGWTVDGLDLSFMNPLTGKFIADVKRLQEHFTNLPGQATKIPFSRAQYLVTALYKAQGLGGYDIRPPSKLDLVWRNVKKWAAYQLCSIPTFKAIWAKVKPKPKPETVQVVEPVKKAA